MKPEFKFGRERSMSRTLSMLQQRNALEPVNIVEVGVARGDNQEHSNGHSTALFAWFIKMRNMRAASLACSHYIGVDISAEAIAYANNLLVKHNLRSNSTVLVEMDAIQFFNQSTGIYCSKYSWAREIIDLLYLDGWDYSDDPEKNRVSEQGTLDCLKAAEPSLDERSMVLFDDVFGDNYHGKGKLAIPYLQDKGWISAFGRIDNQVLMIKNYLA